MFKRSSLFTLILFSSVLCVSNAMAQDPNDVVTDLLDSNGNALVVEAFYGAGGVLSSADDANFSNTSFLVVDHNDGNTPVAYGYRWNDDSTYEDLLVDVIFGTINNPNDEALFATFGSFTGFGNFINGIGYDQNGDGLFGDLSSGISQADFLAAELPSSEASALNVGDSYQESLADFSAFWNIYVSDENPYLSGEFVLSDVGLSGITNDGGTQFIENNAFLGLSFGGFGAVVPGSPDTVAVGVPEPTGLMFLWAGAVSLSMRRRRC